VFPILVILVFSVVFVALQTPSRYKGEESVGNREGDEGQLEREGEERIGKGRDGLTWMFVRGLLPSCWLRHLRGCLELCG